MNSVPQSFRYWFYAAAAYNFLWGLVVCLFPSVCIEVLGIGEMVSAPFLQVLGMVVGVYAYGYWLMARDPVRYCGFIWIGLVGKVLGPLGFLFYALRGEIPWSFGATIVFNDLVWWPAFLVFAFRFGRRPLD
ncbi:MAG: hypothetical protein WD716_13380 [Fimbriimonadaceae bacterium]